MTIGSRIKKIRKELDLTQAAFASRIGSVQNSVTGYENGRRNPSQPVISLICSEFNVNEKWLKTGEGEMFNPVPTDTLEILSKEYNLTPVQYEFIKKFVTMKQDTFNELMDFFDKVLKDSEPFNTTTFLSSNQNKELSTEERVKTYREYLETKEKATEKLSG